MGDRLIRLWKGNNCGIQHKTNLESAVLQEDKPLLSVLETTY